MLAQLDQAASEPEVFLETRCADLDWTVDELGELLSELRVQIELALLDDKD
jgi:hypothetical protein